MTVYFEAPIDQKAAAIHRQLPELRDPFPKSTVFVAEGDCLASTRDAQFVSKAFSVCSGLIFRNERTNTYGLFHIYPHEELDPEIVSLGKIVGARGILVEGSRSTSKELILQKLAVEYGVEIVRSISVDTVAPGEGTPEVRSKPFHIIYRPMRNEVIVARISHHDILTFRGF